MRTQLKANTGAILAVSLLVVCICVPSCKKKHPYDLAKLRAEGDNILNAIQQYCLDTKTCFGFKSHDLVPKYLPYAPKFGNAPGQWACTIVECKPGQLAKVYLFFTLVKERHRLEEFKYTVPRGWETVSMYLD